MSDDVLWARAFLSRVAEPTNIPLWDFVRSHGPVCAVARIRAADAPSDVLSATNGRLAVTDPEADLDAARRDGIRLVVPESDEWPHFAFAALEATGERRLARYRAGERTHADYGEPIPPLALWVQGGDGLPTAAVRSAGIIGARAATSYGEQVASDLAYGLARRGFTVVSGGAYGIDAAAHRGALAAGGQTVIVSAAGLDRPYPSSNANLYRRAAEQGFVVSESPPGAAPHRRRFLTRNRIVAALSTGCVVVEASARSGATNTAHHARRLGRALMAVPGPVTSGMSVGCHRLLRLESDPAVLVTGVEDVLAVIGSAGDVPAELPRNLPPGGESDVRSALDLLDPTSRAVYDGLPTRVAASIEQVAVVSGLSPLDVVRAIPSLELAGLITSTAAGVQRVAGASRPGRRQDPGRLSASP